MPAADGRAAGRLRRARGVEVLLAGDQLWLRSGPEEARSGRSRAGLERLLDLLPGSERFLVDSEGRLTPRDRRLPAGRLPAGRWLPIAEWMRPVPPESRPAGAVAARVPLTLVRTYVVEEPTVLVAALIDLASYVLSAPAARLSPLRFAAAADGVAAVRGRPLPPVAGRLLVEHDGVAVPCGYRWSPALGPAAVHRVLGLAPGDLALMELDGSFESIEAESLVRLTRQAMRRTLSGLAAGER